LSSAIAISSPPACHRRRASHLDDLSRKCSAQSGDLKTPGIVAPKFGDGTSNSQPSLARRATAASRPYEGRCIRWPDCGRRDDGCSTQKRTTPKVTKIWPKLPWFGGKKTLGLITLENRVLAGSDSTEGISLAPGELNNGFARKKNRCTVN
jgi:hypothetical protein